MTSNRPRISAFFPAYNDGGTIGSLVVTTLQTLAEVSDDYEMIVLFGEFFEHLHRIVGTAVFNHMRLHSAMVVHCVPALLSAPKISSFTPMVMHNMTHVN